jgi:glycerol-3-phosphate O-acyltransferase / dihydroxyacetone phosphate acyltransferase
MAKAGKGTIYLPDPVGDPSLVRGNGTKFDEDAEAGGMMLLPSVKGKAGSSQKIEEVLGPEELRLKRPFKEAVAISQLTGRKDVDDDGQFKNTDLEGPADGYQGTKYKLAPHVDQTKVYNAVFSRFRDGDCVAIFPEGGSHDRTALLPLKPGVAIMALGALAEHPDCGLKIVPCGLNYFHAHKFRSRAVIEFGKPFEIPKELVDLYREGRRADAIGAVLDMVHQALLSVTVVTPDYDTLMMIQAARRLYTSQANKIPLGVVIEANRRLAKGYEVYKEDPRVKQLMEAVKSYNAQLRYLNIRDHQLERAKTSWPKVTFLFFKRLFTLMVLSIVIVPGALLFAPVFALGKWYSRKKAAEALAASTVKIEGKDVIATWKLLVSLLVAPIFYNFYCVCLAIWISTDGYRPEWVPEWIHQTKLGLFLVWITGWVVLPTITYLSLRFGEVGMDIVKSLRVLFLCMIPTSKSNVERLRLQRERLQVQVNEVIDTLGPELYPDWENQRLIKPQRTPGSPPSPTRARSDSEPRMAGFDFEPMPMLRRSSTISSQAIPRNESFSNIGHVPLFATTPPSTTRSRSSSYGGGAALSGFPLQGMTTLDSKDGFKEAKRKMEEHQQDLLRKRYAGRRKESLKGRSKDDGMADEEDDSDDDEGLTTKTLRKKDA